jgi:hypothetical protein
MKLVGKTFIHYILPFPISLGAQRIKSLLSIKDRIIPAAEADTGLPPQCVPFESARAGQIPNGAGQLQNAVIGPRAQLQLLHGGFEQIGAGFINRGEFADFGRPHPTGKLRTPLHERARYFWGVAFNYRGRAGTLFG